MPTIPTLSPQKPSFSPHQIAAQASFETKLRQRHHLGWVQLSWAAPGSRQRFYFGSWVLGFCWVLQIFVVLLLVLLLFWLIWILGFGSCFLVGFYSGWFTLGSKGFYFGFTFVDLIYFLPVGFADFFFTPTTTFIYFLSCFVFFCGCLFFQQRSMFFSTGFRE